MYYMGYDQGPYLLLTSGDLLQEEGVDGVHLWQVGLALLNEEVIDVLLGLHFLHQVMDVHLGEVLLRLVGLHVLCLLVKGVLCLLSF